jgi:hypothetical protein
MSVDVFRAVNYSELSLLFAVLYGISSLGLRLSKGEDKKLRREEGERRDSLKLSSTIAFIGILVSFSLASIGPLIPDKYSQYFATAPVVLVGLLFLWWYYERRGSKVIDFELLANSLDKRYEDAILETARELKLISIGMSSQDEKQLYEACLAKTSTEAQFLPEPLSRIIPVGTVLVSVKAIESIALSFVFSRERFDNLLSGLRERKVLLPRSEKSYPPLPPA